MSAQVKLKMVSEIKDISSHALVKSTDASRTYDGGDVDTTLTSATTPDVEGDAVFTATLSGGALTIDLTAMTNADGDSRSASGKSLRTVQIANPASNTGNIVITKGASNGHSPVGTTFTWVIPPGGCLLLYFYTAAGAVGGSSKNWDCTGTGTESFKVKVSWG